MNKPEPEKPIAKSGQHPGAKEAPESIQTFPLRTKRPGNVGLANEMRPGLGTRGDSNPDVSSDPDLARAEDDEGGSARTVPHPPEKRGEPSEQDPNSLEQEQQRSTGVSGHAGAT
jgi:hypothetical protein